MRRFLFTLCAALAIATPLGAQGVCDSVRVAFVKTNLDSVRYTTTGTVRPPAYLQRSADRLESRILQWLCGPPPVDTTPPPAPKPNQPPVAAFAFVCVPGPSVEYRCTFDASASSDPDGSVSAYTWSSPGRADRTGATTLWGFEVGTHSVTLTVVDDSSASHAVTQPIVISGGGGGTPPPSPPPPTPPPGPTPPPNVPIVPAALPRDSVDVSWRAPTGRTLTVNVGGNLQAALDSAKRGDEVVLQAGATFTGHFVLKPKTGTGWVLVRTSALAQLPPLGTRLDTLVDRPKLATLASAAFGGTIATQAGASGWRFVGLEITSTTNLQGGLVLFGDGSSAQNALAGIPTDLILDRVWVHGTSSLQFQRCVALNSARTAIVHSALTSCHTKGMDAQAIGGWNGPGPYRIENNYLEGSGENLMLGGADPHIANMLPSDVTIRGNYFSKPLGWRGVWTIKNLLELKIGRYVLIEGNVFEHSWTDGQSGVAILFKSTNQSGGAPWAQTADVTFRWNVVRGAGAGVSIAANPEVHPVVLAARFLIEENIFEEIGTFAGTTNGRMVQLNGGLADVELRHNTMLHNAGASQFVIMDNSGGGKNLVVRDNVATWGNWGAVMGNAPQGSQALAMYATPYAFAGNVVVSLAGAIPAGYPTGNAYTTLGAVGFVDASAGDYTLGSASPHKGKATDGKDPGANIAAVRARAAKAIAGVP